jgi:hypothetical protein
MRDLKGVLLISDEQPHVSGHIVIDGEHFAVTGWRKSKVRIEIEGWQFDEHGAASEAECDPA